MLIESLWDFPTRCFLSQTVAHFIATLPLPEFALVIQSVYYQSLDYKVI